jgi:hypothetical protein
MDRTCNAAIPKARGARKRPGLVVCHYHWERQRLRVPALRFVGGVPMCRDCFDGRELVTIPKVPQWRAGPQKVKFG